MSAEALDALDHLVTRLEAAWLRAKPEDGSWCYQHIHLAAFVDGLEALVPSPTDEGVFAADDPRVACWAIGRRFMDVGCGLGTYLALAHFMGWETTGIERHGPYVNSARALAPFSRIVDADAFDVGFFDTDVLYEYRLCKADADERRLITHFTEHTAPGTILWLPLGDAGLGLPGRVGPNMWRR